MDNNNMKTYMIIYKDRSDYGCGEEIEAINENNAIRILQNSLLKEGNFMSRLVNVEEILPQNNNSKWIIKETGEDITDKMNF